MMQENDCGCIPVVDSQAGMKPVGTITDRDITIRTIAANHNPINMKASDVMTTDIATVSPQMSAEECFDVMEDREIRRVLVVDEQGKCCGIVAQADIVQSGANPARTNKVIREISESAPSRDQGISMGRRNYESHSDNQTFMSAGSLLPFLIGLGSGVALMSWLNAQQRPRHRAYFDNLNTDDGSDYLTSTNQENLGKYVDAEKEVAKRQHDLEARVQTLRTESILPLGDRAVSIDRKEETIISKDKGLSANQE
jgi:hypothetical protein